MRHTVCFSVELFSAENNTRYIGKAKHFQNVMHVLYSACFGKENRMEVSHEGHISNIRLKLPFDVNNQC